MHIHICFALYDLKNRSIRSDYVCDSFIPEWPIRLAPRIDAIV